MQTVGGRFPAVASADPVPLGRIYVGKGSRCRAVAMAGVLGCIRSGHRVVGMEYDGGDSKQAMTTWED